MGRQIADLGVRVAVDSRIESNQHKTMSSWKQIAAGKAVLSRETGTIIKDHGGKLTVALAYPNTYSVGMASLALQILYRLFNARPDVVCERVFWDEAAIAAGQPLLSLETGRPVARVRRLGVHRLVRDGLFPRGCDAAAGRHRAARA